MSGDLALFDMSVPAPEPAEKLSDGRRRTIRQLEALRHGQHPIGLSFDIVMRLHPDAPPADDRSAPGPRCGSCRFRELATSNGNKSFPKCLLGWDGDYRRDPPYASHGAATDCRAWWPGCQHWERAEDGS